MLSLFSGCVVWFGCCWIFFFWLFRGGEELRSLSCGVGLRISDFLFLLCEGSGVEWSGVVSLVVHGCVIGN